MSLRLFVAVEISDQARETVEQQVSELRNRHPWVRWTDAAGWHLTLTFLGWVEEGQAADAVDAVRTAAQAGEPCTLELEGRLGMFGRRVLWAGVSSPEPLVALTALVRKELSLRDVPFEDQPLRPHLTVARAPRDRRMPKDLGAQVVIPAVRWEADEVLLMRSHLGRVGARYEVALRAPLQRGRRHG